MKRKRFDKDMPMGKLQKVDDFLPPPEKLVLPERTIKVTLRLNKSSVQFFKEQARKYHTKYQKMLRFLVDKYVERYSA
ncbi:MAG: CopG family transcriptional regulator [Candidatus Omnitrophica bacterium]|nr:CopG family transcriptional regulator [Candidatus Omnitrophota bacterium]